jgi:hypothetical protein
MRLSLVGRGAVPGVERGRGARVGQRLRGRDSHPLGPHLTDSRLHSAVRNKNLHRLAVDYVRGPSSTPSPKKWFGIGISRCCFKNNGLGSSPKIWLPVAF